MPPFHFTKAKNKVRTDAYGINDGRMSGRIFGAHRIDWIKSAGDKNYQNSRSGNCETQDDIHGLASRAGGSCNLACSCPAGGARLNLRYIS
jgi:hypothetical protein